MGRAGVIAICLAVVGCTAPTSHPTHPTRSPSPSALAVINSPLPESPEPEPTPTAAVPGQQLQLESIRLFNSAGWATDTLDWSGGAVLFTADGGATWRAVNPWRPTLDRTLGAAAFVSADMAVVSSVVLGVDAHFHGEIWRTADRGHSWHVAIADFVGYTGSFSFDSSADGWFLAVNQPGSQSEQQGAEVWRTHDGGQTWTLASATLPEPPGGIPFNCGKSAITARDRDLAWITGGCPGDITFLLTRDGGRTWSRQPLTAAGGPTFACAAGPCLAQPVVLLGGSFGYVVVSDNVSLTLEKTYGGSAWNPHRLPSDLRVVALVDAADGYATFDPPLLETTHDGGLHWASLGVRFDFTALDCANYFTCVATLGGGAKPLYGLVVTSDGWRHWRRIVPLLSAR